MIVDDNVVCVMELEEALSHHSFHVVGIAYSGAEAVEKAEALKPNLVLMDIEMPGGFDGIDAAEKILQQNDIPIIFVTGHDDEELLERAARLNPAGYILKPFVERQIIATIQIAFRSIEKPALKVAEFSGESNCSSFPDACLTVTESRVVNLIKAGKSSKDIAQSLKISRKTVDWHRNNIRRKLKLNNRESLFSYFQKS